MKRDLYNYSSILKSKSLIDVASTASSKILERVKKSAEILTNLMNNQTNHTNTRTVNTSIGNELKTTEYDAKTGEIIISHATTINNSSIGTTSNLNSQSVKNNSRISTESGETNTTQFNYETGKTEVSHSPSSSTMSNYVNQAIDKFSDCTHTLSEIIGSLLTFSKGLKKINSGFLEPKVRQINNLDSPKFASLGSIAFDVKNNNSQVPVLGKGATENELNESLQRYVNDHKGSGVSEALAAVDWLYANTRNGGAIELPYQMNGSYHNVGIDREWLRGKGVGLDCSGLIKWAFKQSGKYPWPYKEEYDGFSSPKMNDYAEKNADKGYMIYLEHTEDEDGNNIYSAGTPFKEVVENNQIQPGDLLERLSDDKYSNAESEKSGHIAIVMEVNVEEEYIKIIHASGGNPGIVEAKIGIESGKYESGTPHKFTRIIRMTVIEEALKN